jgi:hypothetical protein
MTVSITDLYDILSAKLGKEEAKTLVTFIEEKVEKQVEQKATILATKNDLNDLERHINTKLWTAFVTLAIMILGLYAAILLK